MNNGPDAGTVPWPVLYDHEVNRSRLPPQDHAPSPPLLLGPRLAMVVAPEADNLADAESRVRSEASKTGTTALPAVDANLQLDCIGSLANAAEVIAAFSAEFAAGQHQSV